MAHILKEPLPEYIMSLERENEKLRSAAKPFSIHADCYGGYRDEDSFSATIARNRLTVGHLRKLRAALTAGQTDMTDVPPTPKEIVEKCWRPHLGALHTMITAADYDGVFKLVASISTNIAVEAAKLTTAKHGE